MVVVPSEERQENKDAGGRFGTLPSFVLLCGVLTKLHCGKALNLDKPRPWKLGRKNRDKGYTQ
jgi:hypothetical protein